MWRKNNIISSLIKIKSKFLKHSLDICTFVNKMIGKIIGL